MSDRSNSFTWCEIKLVWLYGYGLLNKMQYSINYQEVQNKKLKDFINNPMQHNATYGYALIVNKIQNSINNQEVQNKKLKDTVNYNCKNSIIERVQR